MPYRAKLTTRQETTSQYPNTDNLAKGSELDFDEADSNFLNLRDQSIGIADDTSTVIDVGMGNTLTVTGTGGIATSVSGQTLTIDGTSVSGGGTTLGNLQVNDTDLSPITTNDSLTITANGTGNITLSGNAITINGNTITAKNEAGTETLITANQNGAVELYYDNNKKLETVSGGVTITGTLNTHTIPGGTGTLALTSDITDQNIFQTITADTGSTTANTTTDTLTVAGGSNVTTSITGDTLTINASVTGGGNTYYSFTTATAQITPDLNNGNIQLIEITSSAPQYNLNKVANMSNGDQITLFIWNNSDGDPPESGGGTIGINIGNFKNHDSNDIMGGGPDKLLVVEITKIDLGDSEETQILTFPGTLDVPSMDTPQS